MPQTAPFSTLYYREQLILSLYHTLVTILGVLQAYSSDPENNSFYRAVNLL